MNLLEEFEQDIKRSTPVEENNDVIEDKKEGVTTEGFLDFLKSKNWNIRTTLRLLKLVADITIDSDDDKGFMNNLVLIHYSNQKVNPTAINKGIGVMTAFLNNSASKIVIDRKYENDAISYKSKHITRFFNNAKKYVDLIKTKPEKYEEEIGKFFSDGLGFGFVSSIIKNADKHSISNSDKSLLEKYSSLVERVVRSASKEFYLVEEEPTVTAETAITDKQTYQEEAEDIVLKLDDIIKKVKGEETLPVSLVVSNMLDDKLCLIKK